MSPRGEARKHFFPNQFSSEEARLQAKAWIEKITPTTEPCLGDQCRYKLPGDDECKLTVHHTIFPRSRVTNSQRRRLIYSRRTPASMVLTHECRHADIHNSETVPPPEDDQVIAAYYSEAKVIEDLAITTLSIDELEFETSAESDHLDEHSIQVYLTERAYLRKRRQELLDRMAGFNIIGEAVVLGALLELAPEIIEDELSGDEQVARLNLSDRTVTTLKVKQKEDGIFWQRAA